MRLPYAISTQQIVKYVQYACVYAVIRLQVAQYNMPNKMNKIMYKIAAFHIVWRNLFIFGGSRRYSEFGFWLSWVEPFARSPVSHLTMFYCCFSSVFSFRLSIQCVQNVCIRYDYFVSWAYFLMLYFWPFWNMPNSFRHQTEIQTYKLKYQAPNARAPIGLLTISGSTCIYPYICSNKSDKSINQTYAFLFAK